MTAPSGPRTASCHHAPMSRSLVSVLALVLGSAACGSNNPPPAGADGSVLADAGINVPDAGDFAGPSFAPSLIEATSANYLDLALSSDGAPWVAYRANRVPTLAHREGSAWRIEAVSQLDGEDLDVELGPDGRPIVSFVVGPNLHVATFDGTRWSDEDAGLTGVGAHLEVAPDGSLHAAAGNRYLRPGERDMGSVRASPPWPPPPRWPSWGRAP